MGTYKRMTWDEIDRHLENRLPLYCYCTGENPLYAESTWMEHYSIVFDDTDGIHVFKTFEDRAKFIIQYKHLKRVKELISRITIGLLGNNTFKFIVEEDKRGGDRIYIQVEYSSPCTKDTEPKTWKGRKWYLSEYMLDNEIIFTAYTAYKMCVEHEIMETFKVDNIILVNPHVDYKELLAISNKEVAREQK